MIRDRQPVARYLVERGGRTDLLMAAAMGDESRVTAALDADPSAIRMVVSEEWFPKTDPRSGGSIYNWTLGTGKSAHVIAHEFGHAGVLQILLDRSPDELRLAVACETGDEPTVRELRRRRPELIASLGTADLRRLPDAARDGNREAVRLMLVAGWPVDARGQHGGTALHWAGWHGDTTMARDLLRHGPALEITDHDYAGTPLFWTVYGSVHGWRCRTGDYVGTAEVLLEAGALAPQVTDDMEASDAVRELLLRWKK